MVGGARGRGELGGAGVGGGDVVVERTIVAQGVAPVGLEVRAGAAVWDNAGPAVPATGSAAGGSPHRGSPHRGSPQGGSPHRGSPHRGSPQGGSPQGGPAASGPAASGPSQGHLTFWVSTQNAQLTRAIVTGALGLDASAVRVIAPDVGGGVGAELGADREAVLVAWAAKRTGPPLRWVEARTAKLPAITHGRGQRQTIKIRGARGRPGPAP